MYACQMGYACPWGTAYDDKVMCTRAECCILVTKHTRVDYTLYDSERAVTMNFTRTLPKRKRREKREPDPVSASDWERIMRH